MNEVVAPKEPEILQRNFSEINTKSKPKCFVRLLSWNMLAQASGEQQNILPAGIPSLEGPTRRDIVLQEIAKHQPDVICLQEIDHFRHFDSVLGASGYIGEFLQAPSSDCLAAPGDSGSVGIAIFYNATIFDWIQWNSRILKICRINTDEVILGGVLRARSNNIEVFIAVTQLKAGSSMYKRLIRAGEGRDVLRWVQQEAHARPIILCGDFNTEPNERLYRTIMCDRLNLKSAYRVNGHEPEFTSWKRCGNREVKKTIDYIFHSKALVPFRILEIPDPSEVGPDLLPSEAYPSDHLALIVDFGIHVCHVKRRRVAETYV